MERECGGQVMKNGATVYANDERFFCTCVTAFERHWSSLVQMSLRKKPAA